MTDTDLMYYFAGMLTMVFFRWFSKTVKLINKVDELTATK